MRPAHLFPTVLRAELAWSESSRRDGQKGRRHARALDQSSATPTARPAIFLWAAGATDAHALRTLLDAEHAPRIVVVGGYSNGVARSTDSERRGLWINGAAHRSYRCGPTMLAVTPTVSAAAHACTHACASECTAHACAHARMPGRMPARMSTRVLVCMPALKPVRAPGHTPMRMI